MVRWFQRLAWAIGRPFCEVPSDVLGRRIQDQDVRHLADLHVLKTQQAENNRLLKAAEAHMTHCDERHRQLQASLDAINGDRLELLRLLQHGDEPPALRLVEDG